MEPLAKLLIPITRWIERNYILALTFFFVLAGFFGIQAAKLRVRSDYAELLPASYPSVQQLQRIVEKVGSLGNLIVIIDSADFEANKSFAKDLTDKLKNQYFVKYIDYKLEADFFRDNVLLYSELDDLRKIKKKVKDRIVKEKQKRNPLFFSLLDEEEDDDIGFEDLEKKYLGKVEDVKSSGYYASEDGRVLLIVIRPVGSLTNVGNAKKIIKLVDAEIEALGPAKYHPSMQVGLSGTFRGKVDEYRAVMRDLKFSAFFAMIGVSLLLMIYFRQLLAPLFVVLPLLMALAITFGLTYWVIGSLNTITSFLIAVLLGLGIDYGIHVYSRFCEERAAGKSTKDALELSLARLVRASATAAATTVVAFYSLMLTDFKGFRHFGFIAGTGILLTFLSYFTIFPSLMLLFDRIGILVSKPQARSPRAIPLRQKMPLAVPFLIIGAAFTLVSLICLPGVRFEYNFKNLRIRIPAQEEWKKKVRLVFKGSFSPAIVISEDHEALKEVISVLENIRQQDETPTIASVRSLQQLVPNDQDIKLREIAYIHKLLEDDVLDLIKDKKTKKKIDDFRRLTKVDKPIVQDDIPPAVLNKFRGEDGSLGDFAYVLPDVSLSDGRAAIRFAEDVAQVKTGYGTFYASSDAIIFADMLRAMARDGKRAIIYTFLAVFLLLLLDRRSLLQTTLIVIPLITGILWMIGLMVLFDIKLNFLNAVVLPSIIGIAVDHGVHIYHRYRAEGARSLGLVVRRTGGAVFLSSLTTIIGFSGLLFATHPGMRSIGLLAVIGMLTSMLTALLLLPSLLQVLENRRHVWTMLSDSDRPLAQRPSAIVLPPEQKEAAEDLDQDQLH